LWRDDSRLRRALVLAASCLAIAAPLLLVFGGWDDNRWVFLVITNFFFVAWLSLGDRTRELAPTGIAIPAVVVLLFSTFSIYYFDRGKPRGLSPTSFMTSGAR
jgi:hypothetical protein